MTYGQKNTESLTKRLKKQLTPSPSTSPIKSEIKSANTICVKQPGGKDFTISLSHPYGPLQNNKSKVTLITRKDHGPVSIIIHSTPKRRINTHPCFNTLADQQSTAIVDAMKRKLSYKIHSPADNLKISLIGDTLVDTIGNSMPTTTTMLLKGGERGFSAQQCKRDEITSTIVSNLKCIKGEDQHPSNACNNQIDSNLSNAIKLNMPRSGVKLNIKIGKDNHKVRHDNAIVSCYGDKCDVINSETICENKNCNKSFNDNERLCLTRKFRGYLQPTVSSLIATRMTKLRREMLMNSIIAQASAPPPPFINF